MNLDNKLAAALDALGVPRVEESENTAGVAISEPEAKSGKKSLNERPAQPAEAGTLSKADARKFKEQEEKIGRLERRVKKLSGERDAFASASKEAKEKLKAAKNSNHVPLPARNDPAKKPVLLSMVHPKDCDLHVQLQGDIIMIALINHFAVTSMPLKQIEDHKVALHEASTTMLRGLDEWPWLEENIETCARQWRCLNRVPLVHDYVMDNRIAKHIEIKLGIPTLTEAYEKRHDLPGVGAKSVARLEEAHKLYEADKAKVLKQSVKNLAKQVAKPKGPKGSKKRKGKQK